VISYSHQDNHILQGYAQLIDELGGPAVDHLNRFGTLPNSFVADQRAKKRNRNMTLYIGLLAGSVLLAGGVMWSLKK